MSDESFDEFMGHVKQGAIEVGTDIFNAAANLFSELLEPSDSSSIDYELSPSYVSEYDGLTLMVTGRHTIILDKQGNTLQKIDENLFRLNDNINLRINDDGITVLESSYSDYGDYKYDLTMDTASPIMVYGLLFTCLISLMILFGIMVKRRRMMIHRRYLLARNSLATPADFAVVDSELPPTAAQKKNINDAPPSYETVTEQDKMLPKYEDV
ncbi:unnamed protein product [Oikopleura dioica]|uniref:Uncharacterized protein n=1 Tax=Oikopleura dioica TaxID=34765 RepID=E4YHL9_OIKDI|nr:unnamed protein product [Oikopleura dioica]